MSDPVFESNNPFSYFTCDRAPTASEPVVSGVGIPTNWLVVWWNTSENIFYFWIGRTEDALVWVKIPQTITEAAHIADAETDAATNAPTDFNVITTLLGTLTNEVNSGNTRYNDLATKYNDLATKVNTLFSHLESQGLQADS